MNLTGKRHIVVLGGGILGVSTAVHLLRSGAAVSLITEGDLANGATGRSLSWLNSAGDRSTAYHQLRVLGIDRYRTLYAEDPARTWLQFDGGLFWDSSGSASRTEERHRAEKSHGYASLLIKPEEIRALTPGIDESAVTDVAIFNPGEGWVSLPHLVRYLMDEFHERKGKLITDAGKSRVVTTGGRATGVAVGDGTVYEADLVLVACGAGTSAILAEHGIFIADRSPLSALVITEPVESKAQAVLNTPRATARPNPGGSFAIDHSWYEDHISECADGSFTIPDEVVQQLTVEASQLIEGNPELVAASWKAGRKPIPGDGEPVLGEVLQLPGCFVAFTHSGATLGLIAGELLADEMLTGQRHPLLASFRPERFAPNGSGLYPPPEP